METIFNLVIRLSELWWYHHFSHFVSVPRRFSEINLKWFFFPFQTFPIQDTLMLWKHTRLRSWFLSLHIVPVQIPCFHLIQGHLEGNAPLANPSWLLVILICLLLLYTVFCIYGVSQKFFLLVASFIDPILKNKIKYNPRAVEFLK